MNNANQRPNKYTLKTVFNALFVNIENQLKT